MSICSAVCNGNTSSNNTVESARTTWNVVTFSTDNPALVVRDSILQ